MKFFSIFMFIFTLTYFEVTVTGIELNTITKTISNKVFFFLSNCTSGPGEIRLLFYSPYANATEVNLEISSVIPVDASLKTVFLIHGFLSDATKDWVNDTISALMQNEPRNIFAVDWRAGACSETIKYLNVQSYSAAARNTKKIGEYVAKSIQWLVNNYSIILEDIWIIGHSLGAHVAGFAGKAFKENGLGKFGRITGLDPAGPLFRNTNASERLDRTDAIFVEVTHTSRLLGLQETIGHVDIYFNGGEFQPSCLLKKPGCSHDRAVDYYIEAIRNSSCQFIAKAWSQTGGYQDNTNSCSVYSCVIVGPLASTSLARSSFYVETNKTAPYCTNQLPMSGVIVESHSNYDPLDENLFDIPFY